MMNVEHDKYIEYKQCIENPAYVISNYFNIIDNTTKTYKPFELLDNQNKTLSGYEKHKHNIVKKYRQAGVSKLTQAYMAIKAGFSEVDNPEVIILLSNNTEGSTRMVKSIREFLKQLPRWVWGPNYYGSEENEKKSIFITDTKRKLVLPNGSQIIAVAASEDALRGYTPTYLVFDEAAFIDNGDIICTAAMSAMVNITKVIVISTPNGMDPLFSRIYMGSLSRTNDFNIINLNWWEDERFNSDLIWTMIHKNKIINVIKNNDKVNFNGLVLGGYIPSNSWYNNMSMLLNNNPKRITQELDAEF